MKKYFIPASVEPVLPVRPSRAIKWKWWTLSSAFGTFEWWEKKFLRRISGIVDLRQSQSCQSHPKGTNPGAVVPDSSRVYDYIKSEFDLSACGRRRTLSSSRSSVGSVNVTFLARRKSGFRRDCGVGKGRKSVLSTDDCVGSKFNFEQIIQAAQPWVDNGFNEAYSKCSEILWLRFSDWFARSSTEHNPNLIQI